MPHPRIIVHPVDIRHLVTQNATFTCVGQGYGFIDVRWIKGVRINERPTPSKSIVITMVTPVSITSTLTIPNLRDRNAGRYSCRYISSGGVTDSDKAILRIGGKC